MQWKTLARATAVGALALAGASFAQSSGPAPVARSVAAGRLSPELQRTLEQGDTRALDTLAAQSKASRSGPGADLPVAAPGKGGGAPYICNSGSCACAGASDCVTMIAADKKCKEGTVGCSDYGCTCAEA